MGAEVRLSLTKPLPIVMLLTVSVSPAAIVTLYPTPVAEISATALPSSGKLLEFQFRGVAQAPLVPVCHV